MKKKNQKLNLSLRLPPALNSRLQNHVNSMGLTKSAFILSLINRELTNQQTATAQLKGTVSNGN